jgi:FkbH-like protein
MYHPSGIGPVFAAEYSDIALAYVTLARTKVLLVDFDDTLWSGVMGDGKVVQDVKAQRLLRELKQAGVLLVALSKNDPRNIRWEEMELAQEDFVLHKISWNPKPRSVAEVAHQLDLDPASFVMIDDNPVERALVTAALPKVQALDSGDPKTWRWLRMMLSFPNTKRTEEAERRTAMYREAAERREAMSASLDYGQMMRELDLVSEWRLARPSDLDRVHELLSRTNQFNTTTLRLSKYELAALIESHEASVWVSTLADKFGKLGLVGAVITHHAGSDIVFDSVVMSCRAMGFGLESLLVSGPLRAAQGASVAVGKFIPTERNSVCSSLFSSLGFEPDGDGRWILRLNDGAPTVPDWLTVVSG